MKTAVVYKENTLGVMEEGTTMTILRGLISKGGLDWMDGFIEVSNDEIRPATFADFNRIGVVYHPDYIVV